jgi:hypothetical protein
MKSSCYEIKRADNGTYRWLVDGVVMGEAMTLREAVALLDAFQQKENGNV